MTTANQFRARQVEQGELWEELKVEHHWFHIVRGMIHRGALADMGVNAWAVYCVIKAHTALNTGEAKPSIGRIADLIGTSHDTVQRAMSKLVELDIVSVTRNGRHNEYTLKESVPMITQAGEVFGFGERQYAPMRFQDFIDDLTRFAKTGNPPNDRNVTINITLNVQQITQGDNGSVTMNVQAVQVDDAGSTKGLDNLRKTTRNLRFLKSID